MSNEVGSRSAAKIRERIWLSIAEKRLRPGVRLKEEELAEIFEVSRARVRQVLTMLASDGLVTILPNRGAFVSEPTAQDARDIFHVRKLVEDRIMERLAGRMAEADFARLEAHVAAENAAHQSGNTSEAIHLAGGFHVLLAELCDSAFLFGIMRDLNSRSSLITAIYRVKHLHNCAPHDHEGLIEALRAGDCATAQATMRKHLENVESELDLSNEARAVRDLRQVFG